MFLTLIFGTLFLKFALTYCEKKLFNWSRKTRTSNSERSAQFLKQNTFLACYCQNKYIGTIKMPIGTNNWDVETYRNKLEKKWIICLFLRNVRRTNEKIIIKVSLFFLLKASFLFKMKGYHNRSFFDSVFCEYELVNLLSTEEDERK